MTRPLAIPVEPLAAMLAPKPKTLNQPKTDLSSVADRSAFRASLKEAHNAQKPVSEPTSVKDAPGANQPTRPEAKTVAIDSADESASAEQSGVNQRAQAETEPVGASDAPRDEASNTETNSESTANTNAAVSETPDESPPNSPASRAPVSVISADAAPSANGGDASAAPVDPLPGANANRSVDTRPGIVDTTISPKGQADGAEARVSINTDADVSARQAESSARNTAHGAGRTIANTAVSARDEAVSAGASNQAQPSQTITSSPNADTRTSVNTTNQSNAAVDAASSTVSAVRSEGAAEQQTSTSGDQQRGDSRSRDGRPTNIPSFTATAANDDAPAVARAESVDQAVKLSQATGRMPTSSIEGLAGNTAPNSTTAVGARDAGAAQFVPMNATAEESSPFASRVVRGLHTMLNHRGGSMTMRLDPPELGALKVQMTLRDGTISAMFTAATAKAHALLREHMGTLRASLESQGLNVERLSVQTVTTSNSNSGANDASARQDQSGAQSDRQQADAGNGQSRGFREQEERAAARRHVNRSFEQSFEEQLAG